LTERVSYSAPEVPSCGVNVTVSVQVAVFARVLEQVPAAAEKFDVPTLGALSVITEPELFESVKVAGLLLVPTRIAGVNVLEIGEIVTEPPAPS
jgi:hypothetical protein